jgi:hypothetical protein
VGAVDIDPYDAGLEALQSIGLPSAFDAPLPVSSAHVTTFTASPCASNARYLLALLMGRGAVAGTGEARSARTHPHQEAS